MQRARWTAKPVTANTTKTANVMLPILVSREAMPVIAEKQNVQLLPAPVSVKNASKKSKNLLTYINDCDIIFEVKNKAEVSTLTQKQSGVWC